MALTGFPISTAPLASKGTEIAAALDAAIGTAWRAAVAPETVTSLAYNPATKQITHTNEAGVQAPLDLSGLAADVFVNGGSYDSATGVLTLVDNSGGTADIVVQLAQPATAAPSPAATVPAIGGSTRFAREDHTHPYQAPSADAGNAITVGTDGRHFSAASASPSTVAPLAPSATPVPGTAAPYAREDHVHPYQSPSADYGNSISIGSDGKHFLTIPASIASIILHPGDQIFFGGNATLIRVTSVDVEGQTNSLAIPLGGGGEAAIFGYHIGTVTVSPAVTKNFVIDGLAGGATIVMRPGTSHTFAYDNYEGAWFASVETRPFSGITGLGVVGQPGLVPAPVGVGTDALLASDGTWKFVPLRVPGVALPLMDGTADPGTPGRNVYSIDDHVHPSDTSRVAVADIADNVTTADASKVLSANQGVVLNAADIASGAIVLNNLELTLKGGTKVLVDVTNLIADVKLSSGAYNPLTEALDMTLSNGAIVSIPVANLLPVQSEMSVQGDGTTANKIKLVNDVAAPGNDKVYGTDATGVRGWRDTPVDANKADKATAINVTANTGLSGGGNLSTTRTIAGVAAVAPTAVVPGKQGMIPALGAGSPYRMLCADMTVRDLQQLMIDEGVPVTGRWAIGLLNGQLAYYPA